MAGCSCRLTNSLLASVYASRSSRVALRERPLQRPVFARKDRIGTQAVTKAQTPLKLARLVYEVQVVGAVSGRRVAQEPPVGERRVERPGYW